MKSSHSLALDTSGAGYPLEGADHEPTARQGHKASVRIEAHGQRPAAAPDERAVGRDAVSPFGPDVILPAQFYDRTATLEQATGEKALMLAVLEDGIRCFQEHLKNPRVRPRLLARQAERWIRSTDWDWPFSFNNVCESLELNPEGLRARLLAPRADSAPPSKPRSSHRVYRLTPRVKPPRRR